MSGSNFNPYKSTDKAQKKIVLSAVGGARLTVSGQHVLVGNRKALALIAYLALNQQASVSREYLAGLLWNRHTEKQGKASLRQLFSKIRKAFGPENENFLTFDRDSITLNHKLMEVDLHILIKNLKNRNPVGLLDIKPNFTIDILHGLDALTHDYTDWLNDFRAQFRGKLSQGLQECYSSGSLSLKLRREMAEVAISLDSFSEDAHRAGMQLAAEDGDTSSALHIYSKLYKTLEEELGMEPSSVTQDLAVKIKTGYFDVTGDQSPPNIAQNSANLIAVSRGVPVPTVAILPFQNLGPDTIPEYFSQGILDDTVCLLATLREPRVISSNSTRSLSLSGKQYNEALKNFGANYVLSGSIRKSADKYKISVQLIDAETGFVEWAKIYAATVTDLFDIQSHIAQNIANKLIPSLRLAELRRTKGSCPEDLTAYHLMIRARDLAFRLDKNLFEEAGDMLRMACKKDPQFAPTFVSMAEWYSIRLGQGWSQNSQEDQQQLEKAATQAINLNEENGRALSMLGHNRTILARDYEKAQILFDKALLYSPQRC